MTLEPHEGQGRVYNLLNNNGSQNFFSHVGRSRSHTNVFKTVTKEHCITPQNTSDVCEVDSDTTMHCVSIICHCSISAPVVRIQECAETYLSDAYAAS